MIIRRPRWSDKPSIDRIHSEFYPDNEYPDFLSDKNFGCSFVVIDEDSDRMILAGGVKAIAEAVFVTDKSFPARLRLDALLQGLGSTIFIATGMKYKQIHAFVNNDESYVNTLKKYGFQVIDAKLLVLDFGEHNG